MDKESHEKVFVSSIWTGQRWRDINEPHEALTWNLSLTPSTEYPSAFGATSETNSPQPKVLHGTWTPGTSILRLVCASIEVQNDVCLYEGTLREDDEGNYTVSGTYTRGNIIGRFCVRTESSDVRVHLTGIWLGEAVPDASLEPFCIPTNPIRWSLSVLMHKGRVFGAGYFDDSGDVPGKPLLFYTVHGTHDRETGHVQLTKKYDRTASDQTAAYSLVYQGQLQKSTSLADAWEMAGKWDNAAAGSFGSFRCYREQASGFETYTHCCSVCHRRMRAGEMRFCCLDCPAGWSCCQACHDKATAEELSRHRLEAEPVLSAISAEGAYCAELIRDALTRFASRPLIGYRTSQQSHISWLSYAELGAAAMDIAGGLRAAGLRSRTPLVIVSDLSPSYVASLLAGLLLGCVLVPLHGALSPESLAHCISLVEPAAVMVSPEFAEKIDQALKIAPLSTSPLRVTIGTHLPTIAPAATATPANGTLSQLASEGRRLRGNEALPPPSPAPTLNDVSAVLFTSGSSGEPKGASYTEHLLLPARGASNVLPLVKMDVQPFHPSFLISLLGVMQAGGRRAFATDLGRWLEDASLIRPTHISAPPVFWCMLQREHAARLRGLLATQQGDQLSPQRLRELQAQVSKNVRSLLGNRLVAAASGGATLSPGTRDFLRHELGVEISDLYGSRETGGITRDGIIHPGVEVKLLPLPDDPAPAPGTELTRGEIVVHTSKLIPAYFRNDKATSAAFVEIGGKKYYRTGDVGELQREGTQTRLRVVDRCGALTKLSQGEWVSPARIEAVLEANPLVAQAFVMADSARTRLVAVVVPSEVCRARLQGQAAAEADLLRELRLSCVHLAAGLRPLEIPQALVLEMTPWSPENNFLTSTLKKRRAVLTAAYRARVDALSTSSSPVGNSIAPPSSLSPRLVELLLRSGVVPNSSMPVPPESSSLAELGADSLVVARLSALVSRHGLALSIRSLYSLTLLQLDAALSAAANGAMLTATHPSEVDWAAEQLLSPALPRCATLRTAGDVLVTGGTGFLGPWLVHSVQQAFPKSGVYVLVRGSCAEDARTRLEKDMASPGLALSAQTYVLCGDLVKPRFGLADANWSMLVSRVAVVVHSGARVDVTAPYVALRAANVGGTKTALELCLVAGARMAFVSSASALPAAHAVREKDNCGLAPQPHELNGKSGYGASKAVAESLLRQAAMQLGLCVDVFRPSAICGDKDGRSWNRSDFSFLLLSAFASLGVRVSPAPLNLHWLPVDFVAQAIVSLTATCPLKSGIIRCFHLVGDGPELDAVASLSPHLRLIPPSGWSAELPRLPAEHRAALLRDELHHMTFGAQRAAPPAIPVDETKAALAAIGVQWPVISDQIMKNCLSFVSDKTV